MWVIFYVLGRILNSAISTNLISQGYPINSMLHSMLKQFETRIGDNQSTLNMYGNPLFLSKDFGARRLKYISQLAIKRPFGYSPLYFLLP